MPKFVIVSTKRDVKTLTRNTPQILQKSKLRLIRKVIAQSIFNLQSFPFAAMNCACFEDEDWLLRQKNWTNIH